MSTTTGSVSTVLQTLANDGLLPSNLAAQQLKTATPAQLLELEIDHVETSTMPLLFSEGASASDSASLSGSLADGSNSATGESLVQALDAQVSNATTSTSTNGTTNSPAASSNDQVGTLFSYLG